MKTRFAILLMAGLVTISSLALGALNTQMQASAKAHQDKVCPMPSCPMPSCPLPCCPK